MNKFGYISGIIIAIVGFIEFLLGLFYLNTITLIIGCISMILGAIAVWLNDDKKNYEYEDNVVATPYYTGRECKYCHVVRPLNLKECDCRKTFK